LNLLLHPDGRKVNMGGKTSVQVKAGDRIRILTPGMQYLTTVRKEKTFRRQFHEKPNGTPGCPGLTTVKAMQPSWCNSTRH